MKENKIFDYAEQFLNYAKRSHKFSKNTVDAYKNDVYKFLRFMDNKGIKNITSIDKNLAFVYYNFVSETLKKRSLMRNISSLRSFFNYLKREGLYKGINPFSNIKFKGFAPRELTALSVQDITKLTKVLHSDGFVESRNKAIILFIYSTGLRASEITNACLTNLDLKKAIYVCDSMNIKRTIPFSKELLPTLKTYLNERKGLLKKVHTKHSYTKYLFLNRRGGKITRQTVYIIVQKKAEEAKLNKNVTPGTLRNSLALHLLSSGTREKIVKNILGYTTVVPKYAYSPNIKRTKFILLSTHPAFKKH